MGFFCSDCIQLQDPHCAWDAKQNSCVSVDDVTSYRFLIQDVLRGDSSKCWSSQSDKKFSNKNILDNSSIKKEIQEPSIDDDIKRTGQLNGGSNTAAGVEAGSNAIECGSDEDYNVNGCAVQQQLVIYTAGTLHIVVVVVSIVGLFLGFIAGYLFSQKFHTHSQYPEAPFIEQHNHLER